MASARSFAVVSLAVTECERRCACRALSGAVVVRLVVRAPRRHSCQARVKISLLPPACFRWFPRKLRANRVRFCVAAKERKEERRKREREQSDGLARLAAMSTTGLEGLCRCWPQLWYKGKKCKEKLCAAVSPAQVQAKLRRRSSYVQKDVSNAILSEGSAHRVAPLSPGDTW